MRELTRDWRPAVVSALAALAVYAVTLRGTYVYDDHYILREDPRMDGGRDVRWGELWTKDYFNGGPDNLYRPLVSTTYAVQARLHGTDASRAWLFHLVNWLLHAAVSAGVAELARRMTGWTFVAVTAGVLFAVHPVHVEAVANVVGRAELMCALGVVGALVLFLGRLTVRRAVGIWACMVLAMLSKEQGILLPLLLIALAPVRRMVGARTAGAGEAGVGEAGAADFAADFAADVAAAQIALSYASPGVGKRNAAVLWLVLLLAWTLAAYLYVRENTLKLKFWWDRAFLDPTINPIMHSGALDRALMPLTLLGRYVALLLAPLQLNPDYGGETIGSRVRFDDPYFYLGATSAVVLVAACVVAVRRRGWVVLFCLLSFALIFGMIGNVVMLIGTNFAERLMYLPSAFACVVLALAVSRFPRRAAVGAAVVVAVLFSVRTVTYAARWNDPPRLYEAAIAQNPRAVRLYLMLAGEQAADGDLDAAAATLAAARAVTPDYYQAWLYSGRLAMRRNDPKFALEAARRAQALSPTMAGAMLATEAAAAYSASTRPASREEDFFE